MIYFLTPDIHGTRQNGDDGATGFFLCAAVKASVFRRATFNSLVRDKGSQKILPVPAATVVQQFDVEAGSGDANNRSEKFRGQETLKGAGGQVD